MIPLYAKPQPSRDYHGGMARRVIEHRIDSTDRRRDEIRVVYKPWSHLAYQAHNNLRLELQKQGRAPRPIWSKLR